MGALSPATRNAQVAMFQRGEVDYLVATDAIGMGLNMDVTHVAFAGLEKFDGRRDRRLTIAEMAQIAGRAGRHQRDGSFGTLGLGGDDGAGLHRRGNRGDRGASLPRRSTTSTGAAPSSISPTSRALIASLEAQSDDPLLRAGAAGDRPRGAQADRRGPGDRRPARRRRPGGCGRPAACPISARSGRCTTRAWSAGSSATSARAGISRTNGSPPRSPGSTMSQGDIEALADRLAGVRSWAYIAHRADWLADPAKWAERTPRGRGAAVSDALARAADPALRRPPHRGAGARHRRARRRRACR